MATESVASVVREQLASCEEWRTRLLTGDGLAKPLAELYGRKEVIDERREQILAALKLFEEEFSRNEKEEVLLFRSPGRVNLRGMHIDQHGGACNAVAFDKETIGVALITDEQAVTVASFSGTAANDQSGRRDAKVVTSMGMDRVELSTVASASDCGKGWKKYLNGSVRALADELSSRGLPPLSRGLRMVLLSDIPQGAGVSSSHALIITFLAALQAANGLSIPNIDLLRVAKLTERYCGTSTGLSDQGAILLSQREQVLHANFYEGDVEGIPSTIRFVSFPEELCLVVVNSTMERNLAGDAALGYALPRFAYSLAQCLLQKVAVETLGVDVASRIDRIANISPDVLRDVGGSATAIKLLKSLPQRVTVSGLLEKHPDLASSIKAAEKTYLSGLAVNIEEIPFRGPLVFGITECERARRFLEELEAIAEKREHQFEEREPHFKSLGLLMNAGHAGDRHDGALDVTNETLDHWCQGLLDSSLSLSMIPGSFRASTPELDHIQAVMLASNAYGASLTGGGMGGCVVGLFSSEGIDETLAQLQRRLEREYYSKFQNFSKGIDELVFAARPIAGAGFL